MLNVVPASAVMPVPKAGTRRPLPGIHSHQITTPPDLVGSSRSATVVALPVAVRCLATASSTPLSDATSVLWSMQSVDLPVAMGFIVKVGR